MVRYPNRDIPGRTYLITGLRCAPFVESELRSRAIETLRIHPQMLVNMKKTNHSFALPCLRKSDRQLTIPPPIYPQILVKTQIKTTRSVKCRRVRAAVMHLAEHQNRCVVLIAVQIVPELPTVP